MATAAGRLARLARMFVFALLLVPVLCIAATDEAVKSELTAYQVTVDQDGKERLTLCDKATKVKPGDLVEYRLVYTNTTKRDVTGLKATLPLPQTTELQPNTAKPGGVWASLDGKTFKPAPLKREVRDPDGKKRVVDVPQKEYRALQWHVLKLVAGASTTLTARVKVTSGDAR